MAGDSHARGWTPVWGWVDIALRVWLSLGGDLGAGWGSGLVAVLWGAVAVGFSV